MNWIAIQSALARAGVSRADIATAQQLSDAIETCHNCVSPLTAPRIIFDDSRFGGASIPPVVYLCHHDEYRIFVRNLAGVIAHTENILMDGLGAAVRSRHSDRHALTLYAVATCEVRRRIQFHIANVRMFDPRTRMPPDPRYAFARRLAKTAITRRRRELLRAGQSRRARITKEISDYDALIVQIIFATGADYSSAGIRSALLDGP